MSRRSNLEQRTARTTKKAVIMSTDTDPCGCDESLDLRVELERVRQLGYDHVDLLEQCKAELEKARADLKKEQERGDRLNQRNSLLESEISLLKPESQAKASMESAYAEMQREVDRLRALVEAAEADNG